jgi:alpha-glucoside transport system permease protein
MKNTFLRFTNWLKALPTHLVLIGLCIIWIIPSLGLLVTSFRPIQDINETGWWTIFSEPKGYTEYQTYCASCHGKDGKAITSADLTDPDLVQKYRRSFTLQASLKREINGQSHMGDMSVPDEKTTATIASYMRRISGIEARPKFTLNNYIDAITGYRGNNTYLTDCASGQQSVDMNCDIRDLTNPRGMGRAFINSLLVQSLLHSCPFIRSFCRLRFLVDGFQRQAMDVCPAGRSAGRPAANDPDPRFPFVCQIGIERYFSGHLAFSYGFGLPYAIYLIRNFMGSLPREIFESAFLDGASTWTAFTKLAIPLSVPALASLGIFQFLWIWNDLLVALVFLGGKYPVLTYQIGNMVTSLGSGWQLLTAAAFISMALPMIIFFALQRYFVRGLLAAQSRAKIEDN